MLRKLVCNAFVFILTLRPSESLCESVSCADYRFVKPSVRIFDCQNVWHHDLREMLSVTSWVMLHKLVCNAFVSILTSRHSESVCESVSGVDYRFVKAVDCQFFCHREWCCARSRLFSRLSLSQTAWLSKHLVLDFSSASQFISILIKLHAVV